MTEFFQCPSDDDLGELAVGLLSHNRFEAVFLHLEHCQHCYQRLSKLEDKNDPFVDSLIGMTTESLLRARTEMQSESQTRVAILQGLRHGQSAVATESRPLALQLPCRIGQYEVQQFIARGGMGEVYAAQHTRLKRSVAIKVIRLHREDDPVANSRFLDEMQAVGELQNPNLVQAFDAWEDDGKLFIVFERLSGQTLQQMVVQSGPV